MDAIAMRRKLYAARQEINNALSYLEHGSEMDAVHSACAAQFLIQSAGGMVVQTHAEAIKDVLTRMSGTDVRHLDADTVVYSTVGEMLDHASRTENIF